jgi:hypothetical protein
MAAPRGAFRGGRLFIALRPPLNVSAGAIGLILSGVFAKSPIMATIYLSVGTLGVIASMPIFWPIPSIFLVGTTAAAFAIVTERPISTG